MLDRTDIALRAARGLKSVGRSDRAGLRRSARRGNVVPMFPRPTSCCLLAAAMFVAEPVSAEEAKFFKPNDVVALVGGEDMVAASELGYLELLLVRAYPGYRLKFRCLAWEGDTVFEQPRMLNYPPLEKQLDDVGATVVLMPVRPDGKYLGGRGSRCRNSWRLTSDSSSCLRRPTKNRHYPAGRFCSDVSLYAVGCPTVAEIRQLFANTLNRRKHMPRRSENWRKSIGCRLGTSPEEATNRDSQPARLLGIGYVHWYAAGHAVETESF